MIIEWLVDALTAVLAFLLDLFPTVTVPSWVETSTSYVADGVAFINGWAAWVPLDALRNGLLFLLLCGAVAFSVRVFRIALSLFTGGGGSAA